MNGWLLAGGAGAALIGGFMIVTAGWDLPPIDNEQYGFRGTGMYGAIDREDSAALKVANEVPEPLWEAETTGPRASEIYENVQVLGHLSDDQFNLFMAQITEWVSPEEGCAYCHNEENLADDSVYTKIVSRHMIEMTQAINVDWTAHVAQTGVTCYTCHRGNPVPENIWFEEQGPRMADLAWRNDQNVVTEVSNATSLPYTYLSDYLLNDREIRVHTLTALPSGNEAGTMDAEWTYALMNHMSTGLGVNCTYCHNSRAFYAWDESPPQRVTAWHGIRMARDINTTHLVPITDVFPDNRLGPTGDVAKVNCTTCHQGVNKPLYGVSMLEAFVDSLGQKSPQ